jgi:glycerate 2-kinase
VHVLIIPDKFKGTLTASAAAEAIAKGWLKSRPLDSIESLPMSDGGDGFGGVMSELLHAKIQKIETVDAAHRPCEANWWWEPKTKTAVIESANVIGLAKLPPGKFHPFDLDTFGLGAVIRAAASKGAKRCVIGIGGSATNDGGFGLARALGWKFCDRDDVPIERWTELHQLAHISRPKRTRWFAELIVAVDVQNPLLGPRGATRVYGPQKGLRGGDFAEAEKCLRTLASIICSGGLRPPLTRWRRSQTAATEPGAGAAGGLGFGLMAFLGARAEPGFELFASFAKLSARLRSADLVITGEGRIDDSTFMGKGVGEIARRCRKEKIPCIALAGDLNTSTATARFFAEAHSLTELTSGAKAKSNPATWLERLAERTAQERSVSQKISGPQPRSGDRR